jgi:hypothetical protein
LIPSRPPPGTVKPELVVPEIVDEFPLVEVIE